MTIIFKRDRSYSLHFFKIGPKHHSYNGTKIIVLAFFSVKLRILSALNCAYFGNAKQYNCCDRNDKIVFQ